MQLNIKALNQYTAFDITVLLNAFYLFFPLQETITAF